MFYDIMDSIIVLLEAICCWMFFDIFYNEDEERKNLVTDICSIGMLFFLYILVSRLLAFNFLAKEVAVIASITATMSIIRKTALKKSVIFALLYQGLLVTMEYAAYIVIQVIAPNVSVMNSEEEIVGRFIVIIDLLLVFLSVVILRRIFSKNEHRILYDDEWIKFIVFPIFTIITVAVILSSFKSIEDIQQMKVLYSISLGLTAMNFFVFYLLEDIVKKEEIIREKDLYETQSKNQLEMYSLLHDNYEMQRSESHDFRNHIICMQALVENHEYESLKEYLSNINKDKLDIINAIDTNHVIINAIINKKYNEATDKHIAFAFRFNDLSNIIIKDNDIVVLLSNLIDNAIEACEKCKEKRVIKVKIINEKENLIISVKNPYCQAVIRQGDDFITTKKKDRTSHGFGIRNIIKIIKKYGGTYVIQDRTDEFFFSIIIPN